MPSVSIWKERVTMKIILLSDVKNVGKKGEVKEVADGYGRNYLIRNHLAVEATRKSMEILEKQKADDKARQDELRREAEAVKKIIESETIVYKVKAGKEGKLFGSVSTGKITELLKEHLNVTVDKKKFVDNDNITVLGKHDVRIELYKGVIATVKLDIQAQ
ncbi:MAG: 50S ribosomal protein L9 [Erysipelotrichaceae bacterium]|nr:50S ribosomal protein L9 [Erysipelotrichaceae bacterium]